MFVRSIFSKKPCAERYACMAYQFQICCAINDH